jgi:hypothetical protein
MYLELFEKNKSKLSNSSKTRMFSELFEKAGIEFAIAPILGL